MLSTYRQLRDSTKYRVRNLRSFFPPDSIAQVAFFEFSGPAASVRLFDIAFWKKHHPLKILHAIALVEFEIPL